MENEDNLQLFIDFINGEIKSELENETPNDKAEAEEEKPLPDGAEQKVGRKPFRIPDFDPPHDKEMAVFTRAKKLSEYIFVITEKSPKKLRWSIITRLQNCSVEIIENLYRANYERDLERRREFQKEVQVGLNVLDFYAETAKQKKAISMHQLVIISREVNELTRLLKGWIRSTREKIKEQND